MYDVDRQIKTFWAKFGLCDVEIGEKFSDATSGNSVRASKFLEGLDLEPIMPVINKYYVVGEDVETYPRKAMVKAFIWRKIKRIKYYTRAARYLENHPDEALELGFNLDEEGNALTPDHESLRHFEKIRLGLKGMNEIMEQLCIQVVRAGNELGLKIGENTGTDSTPLETHNDSAGTYNGHYKKKMVKVQLTVDYDHNLPLGKKVVGGNEGDDQYLEEMLRKTSLSSKENMRETWFDGGYTSNKNIALAHIEFKVTPHYHIDSDWRANVVYEHHFNGRHYTYTPAEEINYLYQKYWREPDYWKEATLEYKMQYLVKKGVYDAVAMYFRNAAVQESWECPDGFLDIYHRRNSNEGVNSYLKDNLGLETHVNGKGMNNIDLHVTECCITLLSVALTRLQHGIKENLSSVAYLT